jgi:hypothetical protein
MLCRPARRVPARVPRASARCLLSAACLLLAATPVAAQSAKSQDEPGLQCAFQRKEHPEYVMWICNAEGSAYARDGQVLWMRTTGAGARVTSRVWSGPAKELVSRGEAIIQAHVAAQSRCARYYHVAQAGARAPGWNIAPASMRGWIASQASRRFPHLCYAADPGAADVILVWGGPSDRLPDAFSVDIPWETGPEASPLRSSERRDTVAGAAMDPPSLKLSAYDVRPGMDDSVIRLGLSLYASESGAAPGTRADWSAALEAALRAVADESTR